MRQQSGSRRHIVIRRSYKVNRVASKQIFIIAKLCKIVVLATEIIRPGRAHYKLTQTHRRLSVNRPVRLALIVRETLAPASNNTWTRAFLFAVPTTKFPRGSHTFTAGSSEPFIYFAANMAGVPLIAIAIAVVPGSELAILSNAGLRRSYVSRLSRKMGGPRCANFCG